MSALLKVKLRPTLEDETDDDIYNSLDMNFCFHRLALCRMLGYDECIWHVRLQRKFGNMRID